MKQKFITEILQACTSGASNEIIRKYIGNQLETYYLERRLEAMANEHQADMEQAQNKNEDKELKNRVLYFEQLNAKNIQL